MLKKVLKYFLKLYLKFFAKLAILVYRPVVIAVTGSVNKKFFCEEIKRVLSRKNYSVQISQKNFNTEIGLALAILNLDSGYNSYRDWLPIMLRVPWAIFKKIPKFLILELGVSDPGDMKYLLSIVKPNVTVVTDITQRYLEGFDDMDELTTEYKILVESNKIEGLIILNQDNQRVSSLKMFAKAPIKTFGINAKSDFQATEISRQNSGEIIKVKFNGQTTEHSLNRFGRQHVQAFLAALIVENFYGEKGR